MPSNNNDAGTIPPQPTDAPPGSLEKVLIMMDRVANGQLPNHPEDIVDREQHKGWPAQILAINREIEDV